MPPDSPDPVPTPTAQHQREWLVYHRPTAQWMRRLRNRAGEEISDPKEFTWTHDRERASCYSRRECELVLAKASWGQECELVRAKNGEAPTPVAVEEVLDELDYLL